jgi:plasmid stabilization system protein ParE
MKRLVYAPAALASLEDIFAWTIANFGDVQAQQYTDQLIGRLTLLAAGQGPKPRPCPQLVRTNRKVAGLCFYREGQHYLILRETSDTLELVEAFHGRMNIEARLRDLQQPDERPD